MNRQKCDRCGFYFDVRDLYRLDRFGAGDYCWDCCRDMYQEEVKNMTSYQVAVACKQCNQEKLKLWFDNAVRNEYICFTCYIENTGGAPTFKGTNFYKDLTTDLIYPVEARDDPQFLELCDRCRTALDLTRYIGGVVEGLFCPTCYSVVLNEKMESEKVDVCGFCNKKPENRVWYTHPTYKWVCSSCRDILDKNESNLRSTLLLPAASTAASTAASAVSTPTTWKATPKCKSCYRSVKVEGEYCEDCEKFMKRMATFGNGDGERFQTIDLEVLRWYCTVEEEEFWKLPGAQHIEVDAHSNFTYFNNNANILFVGHLDKSTGSRPREIFKYGFVNDKDNPDARHPTVYNGNLDDRLGVFMGHWLLPEEYGIQFDVLLTTNEETGGTTAKHFMDWWLAEGKAKNKPDDFQYNWIVEFDRRGTTTVLYQYEDKDWKGLLEKYTKVDSGSFSDISKLERMGCKAANWGTGYIDEHQRDHRAYLENTLYMIDQFINFYWDHKDTYFPHKPSTSHVVGRFGGYSRYDWDEYDDYGGYGVHYSKNKTTSSSAAKKEVCENCTKEVWITHSVYNPDLETTQKLCSDCRNLVNQEHRSSNMNKTSHILVCERCNEPKPMVLLIDNHDVCYNCAQKPFKKKSNGSI